MSASASAVVVPDRALPAAPARVPAPAPAGRARAAPAQAVPAQAARAGPASVVPSPGGGTGIGAGNTSGSSDIAAKKTRCAGVLSDPRSYDAGLVALCRDLIGG